MTSSVSNHYLHHHHHYQFLLSVWRIGPEIMLLQDTLFAAANPASTQELKTHCHFSLLFICYVNIQGTLLCISTFLLSLTVDLSSILI